MLFLRFPRGYNLQSKPALLPGAALREAVPTPGGSARPARGAMPVPTLRIDHRLGLVHLLPVTESIDDPDEQQTSLCRWRDDGQ